MDYPSGPLRFLLRTFSPQIAGGWGLLLIAIWGISAVSAADTARVAALHKAHAEAHQKFAQGVEEVAQLCDATQPDIARQIRILAIPFAEQTVNVDELPKKVQAEDPPGLPESERVWRVKLRKLRADYTNELYLLSRRAIQENQASLAYRLIREVAFQSPDDPRARTALGYKRVKDEWTTPFAAEMKQKGKIWHHRFGWIAEKDIPKYEAGQRLYNGQWITAEKEALLRSRFENGWIIPTEHFLIRTNHSLERGCQMAEAVEVFHAYFKREFAAFFSTSLQIGKLMEGQRDGSPPDLYEIHYFRTREEFVERLGKKTPSAGQINGIYIPTDRVAYFFHNPDASEEATLETMYHEVTHQLLGESARKWVPVGIDRDFWIVEGIACYLESFHQAADGTITVGNPEHPRIVSARQMITVDQSYEPLARYALMGQVRYQQGELSTLQSRYAQATGLTHFFMHANNQQYRDGLIEYLTRIYSPNQRIRMNPLSIEQILGVPADSLDKEYANYMQNLKTTGTP